MLPLIFLLQNRNYQLVTLNYLALMIILAFLFSSTINCEDRYISFLIKVLVNFIIVFIHLLSLCSKLYLFFTSFSNFYLTVLFSFFFIKHSSLNTYFYSSSLLPLYSFFNGGLKFHLLFHLSNLIYTFYIFNFVPLIFTKLHHSFWVGWH